MPCLAAFNMSTARKLGPPKPLVVNCLIIGLILMLTAPVLQVCAIEATWSSPEVGVGSIRIESIYIRNNESVPVQMEMMFIYVDDNMVEGVNFGHRLIEPGASHSFEGTQISTTPGEHIWYAEIFWYEIYNTSGIRRSWRTEDFLVYVPSWWEVYGGHAILASGLLIVATCVATMLLVRRHIGKRQHRRTPKAFNKSGVTSLRRL